MNNDACFVCSCDPARTKQVEVDLCGMNGSFSPRSKSTTEGKLSVWMRMVVVWFSFWLVVMVVGQGQ